MKYNAVVWDWNGTLLDDVEISVETINRMLEKRALNRITVEEYREIFGFPVKPYYELLGFDFSRDDWHEVSTEFVTVYESLTGKISLTKGIRETLGSLKAAGVQQYILSALKEEMLHEMLERFSISGYFDGVCGTNNIYADGKVPRGRQMLSSFPICPGKTLMIGDTLHDAEVAEALGFDILLYTGGHNSTERLRQHHQVIHAMEEVGKLIR